MQNNRHDPVHRKDDKSGLENLIRCIRDRDSETLCIKIPRNPELFITVILAYIKIRLAVIIAAAK